MAAYVKLTNFAVKDGLLSGNPLKVVTGGELDDEFDAIAASSVLNYSTLSSASSNISLQYAFSTTTTMADPGSGIVRFNNAAAASATAIAIDDLNSDGQDISAYLITLDDSTDSVKGTLFLRQSSTVFAIYSVTALTDNSGWNQLTVTYVSGSGTFVDGTTTYIQFNRTGSAGTAATIAVGAVTTGAAGSSASVTNVGSATAATFDFAIPRGDTGATGTAATISVGTVTTGAAGSSASVTNIGSSSAATFDFTIPRGDTGAGDVTGPAASVDAEIALFDSTTGKVLKRASITGIAKVTSGVLSAATAGTDYAAPGTASSWTAAQTFDSSMIKLKGSSTGVSTFSSANSSASNYTVTVPAETMTVGFKNVPNDSTVTGTLTTAMVGKYLAATGAITIPDATFAQGDVITLWNNSAGTITITCTITTAYIAGTDSDKATMTLAARGLATILFNSGTVCVVQGNVT